MTPAFVADVRRIARAIAWRTGLDADDLAQEGLLRVWKAQVRDFPYRLAKFGMIEYMRREFGKGEGPRPIFVPLDDAIALACPSPQPDEALARYQQVGCLLAGLDALPSREREIVEALLRGDTFRSLAERWGISSARVTQLKERALRQLSNCPGFN